MPSRGFQSSVDYKSIIGIGTMTSVDSMIVIWPNRTYSKYDQPAIDKVHLLEQPITATSLPEIKSSSVKETLLPKWQQVILRTTQRR